MERIPFASMITVCGASRLLERVQVQISHEIDLRDVMRWDEIQWIWIVEECGEGEKQSDPRPENERVWEWKTPPLLLLSRLAICAFSAIKSFTIIVIFLFIATLWYLDYNNAAKTPLQLYFTIQHVFFSKILVFLKCFPFYFRISYPLSVPKLAFIFTFFNPTLDAFFFVAEMFRFWNKTIGCSGFQRTCDLRWRSDLGSDLSSRYNLEPRARLHQMLNALHRALFYATDAGWSHFVMTCVKVKRQFVFEPRPFLLMFLGNPGMDLNYCPEGSQSAPGIF